MSQASPTSEKALTLNAKIEELLLVQNWVLELGGKLQYHPIGREAVQKLRFQIAQRMTELKVQA